MNNGKEKLSHYACKSHTARSEKDFRVCPSKLSKDEMENLYFALLDSNLQQKKTINNQQDQIKILNTKVQRMTAHKSVPAFNKDCCSSSKAIINEQNESMADLKKANERLSDRIRTLNMRLCSAKQFLKRSPQPNSYCSKCYTSTPSFKNLSTSALYTKRSESNLQTAVLSSRILDRDKIPNKTTQIASTQVDMSALDGTCQQNKCRTTIDELEQKIVNLEQELDRTHKEYRERVSKLEAEVNSLNKENARVRAATAGGGEKLREKERESTVLLQKLRSVEAKCDDLNAQLIIEKAKVSELETQVKAGDISEQIAKALEVHSKREILLVSNTSSASGTVKSKEKLNMNLDDSGYTETNRSQVSDKKDTPKCDRDISQHIAELQTQLDSIKLTVQSSRATSNGDILKGPPLQSNESQKMAGTSSSLSNDLYTRSMKYFERSHQVPSTLRINDNNMVSNEEVAESPNSGQTQQKSPINKDTMPNVQKNSSQIKTDGVNEVDNNKIIENSNNLKYKECNVNDVREKTSIEKDISETEQRSSFKTVDVTPNRRSSQKKKIHPIVENSKQNGRKENTINDKKNAKFRNNDNCDNKSRIIETSKEDCNNKMDESLAFDNNVATKDVATDEEKLSSSQKSVGQSTFIIETKQIRVTASKETKEHNLGVKANSSEGVRGGRTYSVASPDNTDCEISSLTDLPQEIGDRGFRYTSPGEERATLSDSYYEVDCASLSEGELPLSCTVKKMSLAEVEMRDKMAESMGHQSSLYKMEVALQSISKELTRCRQLQYKQVTIPTPIRRFSYPYNYTLPLQ